mmetsp:Transcript_8775/g.18629  ORF Transcript_8775/g.18629 Transcript_8775/m.18629 type:complete len:473 (-) Transcript_8775:126-1544(-)
MASTRYGKIAEDVELGARPRNVQAREVKWSAPDGEDDSHRQDLQSQLLTQLRRLSTTQKVALCVCILVAIVWLLSASSSSPAVPEPKPMRSGSAQRHAAPKHSWDGITKGSILEITRNGPLIAVDENGPVWGHDIGQVIAGHLVEAASEPVTQDGHTLILLEPAGAVEASRVKIADPEDAALYKSQPVEGQQLEAQDFQPEAIHEGTVLQVVRQGPILQTDVHGAIWGSEAGEVLPGQILHAAAEPVTEDEHTTVLLQNGGAVDISLVQIAEQVAEDAPAEREQVFEQPPEHSPGIEHEGDQSPHWGPEGANEPDEPPSPQEMAEAAYRSRHGLAHPENSPAADWEADPEGPGREHGGDGPMGHGEPPQGGFHGDGEAEAEGMAKHPASQELDALAQQEMQEHGFNEPNYPNFPAEGVEHPDGQLPEPDAQNSVNEAGDHAEPYPEPPQEGAHGQFAGDHIADPASAVDGGQ